MELAVYFNIPRALLTSFFFEKSIVKQFPREVDMRETRSFSKHG